MGFSAASYENFMVPSLFAPWASDLVERANPQEGERVLDVACGTGIVARTVATRLGMRGNVVALDNNPNMINTGRTIAERDHFTIDWLTCPAEQLPFPDESFCLILCQFGLMFFTDKHASLKEMYRVLRSDGQVVLSVWQGLDRHPFYQALHEVSYQLLGRSSVQAVFSLGDSNELRKILLDAGFQQIEIKPVSITAHFPWPEEFLAWEIDVDPHKTPALRNLDPEAQQGILAGVRQSMQSVLDEFMQDDQVVLQFQAHVAQAWK